MSVFKHKVWNQILDGKRSWSVREHENEDVNLFEVEVVTPLRELRDEGRIDTEEVKAPSPGQYRVKAVLIKEVLRLDQ